MLTHSTLGLLTFLAICLLWRFDYVGLLGTGSPPSSLTVAASLCGALWIDSLVGLLLLAGLWLAADRPPSQPWLRLCIRLLAPATFLWIAFVRIADRCYFFYSGGHVDRIALEHLQGDAFDLRLDDRTLIYLLASGCLALLAGAGLWWASRSPARRKHVLLLVAVSLCGWALSFLRTSDQGQLRELQCAPEAEIPLLWLRQRTDPVADGRMLLHPVVKKKLRAGFGISVHDDRELPLVKDQVYRRPLPFERTRKWRQRPNILILFFESFSSALTSVYLRAVPEPDAQPGNGWRSSPASFMTSSTPPHRRSPLSCAAMAPIYRSPAHRPCTHRRTTAVKPSFDACRTSSPNAAGKPTHVHSLTNDFVRTGDAVRRLGFATVVDGLAIGRVLEERRAHWGFSDHQIFRYLTRQLQRRARSRNRSCCPWRPWTPMHRSCRPGRVHPTGTGTTPCSRRSTAPTMPSVCSGSGSSSPATQTTPSSWPPPTMPCSPARSTRSCVRTKPCPDATSTGSCWLIHDPCHRLPAKLQVNSSQLDLGAHAPAPAGHRRPQCLRGTQPVRRPGSLSRRHQHARVPCSRPSSPRQTVRGSTTSVLQDVQGSCEGVRHDPATSELSRCEYLHFYRWKRWLHVNNRVWR